VRASVTPPTTRPRSRPMYPVGIRVDVLDEEVYGCGIVPDADDDRYAARQGHDAEITPGDRPRMAEGCLALTRSPGLPIALASRASWRRPSLSRDLETAQRNQATTTTPFGRRNAPRGGAFASPRFPGQRHDDRGCVFPDPASLHPGYAG